ncbi:MAG: hypothetical protein Sapg2KO_14390 [Saprospiraceae bacterium]
MNLIRSFFNDYYFTDTGQGIERAQGKLNLYSALPRTYLVIILLLLTLMLTAQDVTESSSGLGRTDFKAGYFGNISSNHGLQLGAEYLWKEKVKNKERREQQKTIRRQLLLNGNLGYSTNFATRTQNGVFAYSGLTLRWVNAKSRALYVELNPLGLYRSVLPTTYEVSADKVRSVSFPGRSYHAPSVAIGIGQFRKEERRSGYYLNLQYTLLTNYNADILPIVSLHFGRRFNFSNK